MKAPLTLALLVAISTTSATESGTNTQQRVKRAIPKLALLAPLAFKGGSETNDLPPGFDPNVGSTAAVINSMATSASMSGPFAVMGLLHIIVAAVMAMSYFAVANAQFRNQRQSHYYGRDHYLVKKRSTIDIQPDALTSMSTKISKSILFKKNFNPDASSLRCVCDAKLHQEHRASR